MVELITPESRVRSLARAPQRIPIEVDGAVTYELILSVWTADQDCHDADRIDHDYPERFRTATPDDLGAEIRALGGPDCSIWLSLLGLVSMAPHPHDPDHVLAWLGGLNPQRLRRWILGHISNYADPSSIEAAAEGDMEAVRALIPEDKADVEAHLVSLFQTPGEELRDRLVAALSRFRAEVFAQHEAEFAAAISRAAAAQRAVSGREDPKAVIEEVTNGLDYEIPLGVTRVVLVPTIVVRPLSLIDQQRETLLVLYGMADEFIDSDPEAPPSWLVKVYKALSDDKRLRILRRLAEQETTLDELSELLGVSKSTVHHHISVLRAAGLVRVHIVKGKGGAKESSTYVIRTQALESAEVALDAYIRSTAAEQTRVSP